MVVRSEALEIDGSTRYLLGPYRLQTLHQRQEHPLSADAVCEGPCAQQWVLYKVHCASLQDYFILHTAMLPPPREMPSVASCARFSEIVTSYRKSCRELNREPNRDRGSEAATRA